MLHADHSDHANCYSLRSEFIQRLRREVQCEIDSIIAEDVTESCTSDSSMTSFKRHAVQHQRSCVNGRHIFEMNILFVRIVPTSVRAAFDKWSYERNHWPVDNSFHWTFVPFTPLQQPRPDTNTKMKDSQEQRVATISESQESVGK